MGYDTRFSGSVRLDPPLSEEEAAYIRAFCASARTGSPGDEAGLLAPLAPPSWVERTLPDGRILRLRSEPPGTGPAEGQPGGHCDWTVSEDRSALVWNGADKTSRAKEWMAWLLDAFFGPEPWAPKAYPDELGFLRPHAAEGSVVAFGDDWDDIWRLDVDASACHLVEGTPGKPFPARRHRAINAKYEKLIDRAHSEGFDLRAIGALIDDWKAEEGSLDRAPRWADERERVEAPGPGPESARRILAFAERDLLLAECPASGAARRHAP